MNDEQKKTCGPMYKEALGQYTGFDPEKVRIFAAGFIHGEAEKVYLGACQAAMFRPAKEHFSLVLGLAHDAASRYGLNLTTFPTGRPGGALEVWIHRSLPIGLWNEFNENSPAWHITRGLACGVPQNEIDREFHKRAGYGESCDKG